MTYCLQTIVDIKKLLIYTFLSIRNIIFTGYLFHSDGKGKEFYNSLVFSSRIKEIIDLQINGISVSRDSNNKTVYFVLGLVLGDNSGF